jgi:hypothetical protein
MKHLIAILFFSCGIASAQVNPPTIWSSSRTAPSGACPAGRGIVTIPGGVLYTCQGGTWTQISGGGGSSIVPFTTDGTNVTLPSGTFSVGNTVPGGAPASSAAVAGNLYVTGSIVASTTTTRCWVVIGTGVLGVLQNADIADLVPTMLVPAGTVAEIMVRSDAGTPNVIVTRDHLGTESDVLSAALPTGSAGARACSRVVAGVGFDGATTCTNTLQNTTLVNGDYLYLKSGTAGGTAKWLSVCAVIQ